MSRYATKEQLISIVQDMSNKIGIQIIQVDTLPVASSSNLGAIYQYVGTTTQNYTNGYFYKCVYNNPNYEWQEIKVESGEVYFDQTVTLSTSATTTVTYTSAKITSSSIVDIGVSEWGLVPDSVSVTTGTCTVIMPVVDSARTVTVRLYVR